jgi:hypothetical protein
MATVVERTASDTGRRMLLVGVAGLLLGGIAGGLGGLALNSDVERAALVESAPAITGALVTDIEAVRAQSYVFRAPAPVTDIEAVRAQSYVFRAPAPVTDIEAVRAQSYVFRAPAPVTDIEAVRAQNYEFGGKPR